MFLKLILKRNLKILHTEARRHGGTEAEMAGAEMAEAEMARAGGRVGILPRNYYIEKLVSIKEKPNIIPMFRMTLEEIEAAIMSEAPKQYYNEKVNIMTVEGYIGNIYGHHQELLEYIDPHNRGIRFFGIAKSGSSIISKVVCDAMIIAAKSVCFFLPDKGVEISTITPPNYDHEEKDDCRIYKFGADFDRTSQISIETDRFYVNIVFPPNTSSVKIGKYVVARSNDIKIDNWFFNKLVIYHEKGKSPSQAVELMRRTAHQYVYVSYRLWMDKEDENGEDKESLENWFKFSVSGDDKLWVDCYNGERILCRTGTVLDMTIMIPETFIDGELIPRNIAMAGF